MQKENLRRFLVFNNSLISSLILGLLFTLAVLLITYKSLPYYDSDSYWYIEIAEGRPYNVVKPFSQRFLYPEIIRLFSKATNLSINVSFFIVGTAALIIWATSLIYFLTTSASIPPLYNFAILFIPFFINSYRNYFLPDLFYSMLISIFFIFLYLNKNFLWILLLFMLYITRESTILLSLCILIILIYKKKWLLFFGAFGSTILGIIATTFYTRAGQSNIHNMNDILYLLVKIPFNFLKNMLGVRIWTNTLDYCDPFFIIHLPKMQAIGNINSIGICSIDILTPINTILTLLTIFGVAPAIAFYILKRNHEIIKIENLWFITCFTYGIISYLIGTSIGASVNRLVGYSWPVFFMGIPYFIKKYYSFDKKIIIRITIYYLILSWIAFFIDEIKIRHVILKIGAIVIASFLYLLTLKLISKAYKKCLLPQNNFNL